MRPGAIVALSLTALGLASCGGGPDARERVEDYLRDANRVQAGWADSFKKANDAYVAFSRSELDGNRAVVALDAAERDIRAAHDALGRLRPPADARPLHDKLLRLFEMNIDFADQTALLAAYVPASERALAPLDRTNRRLQRDLGEAEDAEAQARALERFSARLRRILARLGRLDVPQVLRVSHQDQVRALTRTRSYSSRLRQALIDQDAERVAQLLELFREAPSGSQASRRKLARRAIARYNRRYRSLNDAYIEVRREEARLDKAFA
jgi:hypothetical protein